MRPLRAVLALQCLHLAAAEWKFHEYAKHDTACAPRYINVGMPTKYFRVAAFADESYDSLKIVSPTPSVRARAPHTPHTACSLYTHYGTRRAQKTLPILTRAATSTRTAKFEKQAVLPYQQK